MKSFILKIFILACIATGVLSKFQHERISENDYFIYLFKNKNDKIFSEKAPFVSPTEKIENDYEVLGMSSQTANQVNVIETFLSNCYLIINDKKLKSSKIGNPWISYNKEISWESIFQSHDHNSVIVYNGQIKFQPKGIIPPKGINTIH